MTPEEIAVAIVAIVATGLALLDIRTKRDLSEIASDLVDEAPDRLEDVRDQLVDRVDRLDLDRGSEDSVETDGGVVSESDDESDETASSADRWDPAGQPPIRPLRLEESDEQPVDDEPETRTIAIEVPADVDPEDVEIVSLDDDSAEEGGGWV